jgi:hypothetical protein
MIPLLFTPTTLGNKLNFLITRQVCLIDERQNELIARSISERILALANDSKAWDKV